MRERDDAGRHTRYLAGAEIGEGVAGQHQAKALDELPAAPAIRLGQNERELVAAVTGHEVRRADFALHHRSYLGEHTVHRPLPPSLVDLPQPVAGASRVPA